MAIPSGSGSEILQRGWYENLSNTDIFAMFDGTVATTTTSNAVPTNKIVTVLNITATNMSGTYEELFNIRVEYGGSTIIYLVRLHPIPLSKTFVYNEKIVLHPTDQLVFNCDSSAAVDLSFNYIIQDWT